MALNGGVVAFTPSIAAGATTDIQPAAGIEWVITSLGGGATANGIFSTGHVYLYDGTNTVLLRYAEALASAADQAQWQKPIRFGLTNTNRLRIKNITAGALRYCYNGRITSIGIPGVGDVNSVISAAVAAGGSVTVQPPAGQNWALMEAGIAEAGWVDGGGVNRWYPNIEVMLYDGTNEVSLVRGSDHSIFRPLRIAFDNTTYLRIYNRGAAAHNVGYIAQRIF